MIISRAKRVVQLVLVLFAATAVSSLANAQQTTAPLTDCDKLAANPTDARRFPGLAGVQFKELRENLNAALSACSKAIATYPNELRFRYQYARGLQIKDKNAAFAIFKQLVAANYPAAFDNVGWLLISENNDYSNAIKVFQAGYALGDADCAASLFTMIDKDKWQPPNATQVRLELLEKAAAENHAGAIAALPTERARQSQSAATRLPNTEQANKPPITGPNLTRPAVLVSTTSCSLTSKPNEALTTKELLGLVDELYGVVRKMWSISATSIAYETEWKKLALAEDKLLTTSYPIWEECHPGSGVSTSSNGDITIQAGSLYRASYKAGSTGVAFTANTSFKWAKIYDETRVSISGKLRFKACFLHYKPKPIKGDNSENVAEFLKWRTSDIPRSFEGFKLLRESSLLAPGVECRGVVEEAQLSRQN